MFRKLTASFILSGQEDITFVDVHSRRRVSQSRSQLRMCKYFHSIFQPKHSSPGHKSSNSTKARSHTFLLPILCTTFRNIGRSFSSKFPDFQTQIPTSSIHNTHTIYSICINPDFRFTLSAFRCPEDDYCSPLAVRQLSTCR